MKIKMSMRKGDENETPFVVLVLAVDDGVF
jgi:hypothetical protein